MTGGIYGIGTSALQAFQRALATTGHNIANANTPGYSRQRAELVNRDGQGFSNGFIGSGVNVSTVRRVYDEFAYGQVVSGTSSLSQQRVLYDLSSQVDDLLANSDTGLSSSLQSFFDSIQEVADDPTSTAARKVLLTEGETLVSRFNTLQQRLDEVRSGVNNRITNSVSEINGLAQSIADINEKILLVTGASGGQPANDLLDQRDEMVRQLAERVSVNTAVQDDGSLSVFIGSGQALVLGGQASTLQAGPLGPDLQRLEIGINTPGGTVNISRQISGGTLGGVLQYRDAVLNPTQNAIGRVAIGISTVFNEQHNRGVDLNGVFGADFFKVPVPQVLDDQNNSTYGVSTSQVTVSDVSRLTTEDYTLDYDGTNWTLRRNSDNQPVPFESGTGTAADPFIVDGLAIVADPGAAAGDTYLVRPTRTAGRQIDSLITDAREVAAATPVLAQSDVNNSGTGAISLGVVTDINNAAFQTTPGQLTPPIEIRFTSATAYEVVDSATNTVLDTGTYDPSLGEDVFPTETLGLDYGYRVRITGRPSAGDSFTVEFNTGGSGDNRNALLLGELQSALSLGASLGGNATTDFEGAYNELLGEVGTRTRQADLAFSAQEGLLQQAEQRHQSISGVNLDEEAANLLRFQQAYTAAAQVITVANTVFDTLIAAVRR